MSFQGHKRDQVLNRFAHPYKILPLPPGDPACSLPCKRPQCRGIEAVFAAHVASRFRAGRLGIGGDQTFHLRWRLLDGELPARRHPQLVVLLIGTNDLGAVGARGPAALEAASKDVAARSAERCCACCDCCGAAVLRWARVKGMSGTRVGVWLACAVTAARAPTQ